MSWIAGQRRTTVAALLSCVPFLLVGCASGVLGDLGVLGDSDTLATEVFELTNDLRVEAGLNRLTWNDTLAQVAMAHAQDMADRDYFDHYSPEGESVGDRATRAGYIWLWIGENLGAGQTTPEQVVQGWMDSDGHRENLLRVGFTEMGVAHTTNAWGRSYWVQVFGTPMPAL